MTRVVNFEGRRITVPDDASDEEVAEILAAPVAEAAPQEQPSLAQKLGRSTQLAAQTAGRVGASIAGAPFDLAGGVIDAGLGVAEWGVNRFVDEPVELPRVGQMPMGYDHLRESASNLMEAIGVPPIEREDMTKQERLIGDIGQFAGEGAAFGAGLSRAAAKRFPGGNMQGQTARPGDAFLRPYVGKGVRPIVTDTVAGAGTGVGVNFARENYPDSPMVELLAAIGGGFGGAAVSDAPGMVRRTAERGAGYRATDLPYGPNGEAPPTQREVQHTRNFLETQASDVPVARERAGERFDAARRDSSALPTAGVASDDIGLIALERGSRVRNPVPFEEADQLLLNSAQERISGLRDPAADQSAVRREVQQRPDQLAADRDAAALPLLRQAEQSGAVVDPQPVVNKIDQMLGEAKRPAVVNSLREARKMLNRAGTEQLDTSVSGLYETRKAINDIIEGRSDTPTGRYAKKELIEVRNALDQQINAVAPEFGQYLDEYRQGSRPLDVFRDSDAVAKLAETDPRNVAKRVLGGNEYGTEGMLREVNEALKSNPAAQRGWKAAVADVLVDKVTNTNTALTRSDDGPVSIAKLQRVWKQHEGDLAQIFSPGEMAAAKRAHEILEPLGNLSRRSTVGSPTATNQQLTNALEAGLLAYTGNAIATGMIMKRMRVAANMVPGLKEMTLESKTGKLIERMWFDPELFTHIMDTPVRQVEPQGWNAKLNRLIAGTEYLRAEPDEEDGFMGAIMRGKAPGDEKDDDTMEAIGGR